MFIIRFVKLFNLICCKVYVIIVDVCVFCVGRIDFVFVVLCCVCLFEIIVIVVVV